MPDPQLHRVLRQHLKTEALLGIDAVPVRDASAFAGSAHADATAASTPTVTGEDARAAIRQALGTPARTPAAPAAPTAPTAPRDTPPVFAIKRAGSPIIAPDAAKEAQEMVKVPAGPLTPEQKQKLLDELNEKEVQTCKRCSLCKTRIQTVFGEGSADADLMFIGEGPGQNEDEQGRPFVGRAGDLLTKMILALKLTRETVYIANIVKCRPPNNRTPSVEEVQHCWDYLRRQVQIIRPKVIVTLGGPATKTILGTKEGITRIRGTWYEYPEVQPPIAVMPTFHPAYLLRAYTVENRKKVWSDLQAAMERINAG